MPSYVPHLFILHLNGLYSRRHSSSPASYSSSLGGLGSILFRFLHHILNGRRPPPGKEFAPGQKKMPVLVYLSRVEHNWRSLLLLRTCTCSQTTQGPSGLPILGKYCSNQDWCTDSSLDFCWNKMMMMMMAVVAVTAGAAKKRKTERVKRCENLYLLHFFPLSRSFYRVLQQQKETAFFLWAPIAPNPPPPLLKKGLLWLYKISLFGLWSGHWMLLKWQLPLLLRRRERGA